MWRRHHKCDHVELDLEAAPEACPTIAKESVFLYKGHIEFESK